MGLVALACAAVAALVVVFPGTDFRSRVLRQPALDDVGMTFLRGMLRRSPEDLKLRMTMIESEAARGNFDAALREIDDLRARHGASREVAYLEYRLLSGRSDAAAPSPETLRAHVKRLAALDWDPAELAYFAAEAERLGDPAAAAKWYARLAAAPTSRQAFWAAEAVRTGLAGGEYIAAADVCVKALEKSTSAADRKTWFLKAVSVLRAGGMQSRALELADRHFVLFTDDDEVLGVLVALAREVSDHARAQRYAKKLMRMSLRNPARGNLLRTIFGLIVVDALASDKPPVPGASFTDLRMRPFDDEKYSLAYDVFLGAGNLKDAFRVAGAAVRQVPSNLRWRMRFARVAEWTGENAVALEQWHHLARSTHGEDRMRAWDSVLRLAPGLLNDSLLLEAWLHVADRRPLSDDEWRGLSQALERAGHVDEAPSYFLSRYEKLFNPLLLELRAKALEGLGHDDEAIEAYRLLVARHGANGPRLIRLAVLLIRHNRLTECFDVLQQHRAAVGGEDGEFWSLFADLAWQLQRDAAALEGYRVLNSTSFVDANVVRRLVDLTKPTDPGGAARIAAMGFEKYRAPGLLITAAEIYWESRDQTSLSALFARMTPEDEKRMESHAFFHVLRAQHEAAAGRRAVAETHFRRAIAAEPDNPELVGALLWHLVDGRENVTLRRELRAREAKARNDAALWDVYAAAYSTLGEPARALEYYRRSSASKAGDYLWLVNYADVLDQVGQTAMALRVRRHAWTVVRAAKTVVEPDRVRSDAVARLVLAGAPTDARLALVRRLLRQDEKSEADIDAKDRALDAGSRELILSWALSAGNTEAAKAWLLARYASQLERPVWARLGVALAEKDIATLEAMLAGEDAASMPAAERIEAARVTGKVHLARNLAFEAQQQRPDNDDLHLVMSETLIDSASSFVYEPMAFERGVLRGRDQRTALSVWLNEKLRLTVEHLLSDNLRTTGVGAASITGIPSRTEEQALALRWQEGVRYTELRVARRLALVEHNSVALTHARDLSLRVSGLVRLGLSEHATETIPLTLGGMRDRASAIVSYRMSAREYLNAEAWSARYHTQDDAYLGRGDGIAWELGHRFRLEYPDLRARLTGSHQHYVADGALDARAATLVPAGVPANASFMVPRDFDLYGFYLAAGDSYRDRYSRALRPWVDVGRTWNSVSGNGFLLALGGTTSIAGGDRLSFGFTRSKGGSSIGGYTTELGVRYEYLFDRR